MQFKYSLQGKFANDFRSGCNIGIMVWSDSILGYYGVRGHEEHADDMCGRIRDSRDCGRTIDEFVEYFLTRHGGYFYSMTRPHNIQADSVEDVVRQAGRRWELDFVIPEPVVLPVFVEDAQALLDETETGFELEVRGDDYGGSDFGFILGIGFACNSAVLGYLPFPYSFSEFSRGRFWLKSLERTDVGWLARGHDNWNWEAGVLDIEIRPIRDPQILSDIARFRAGLSDEECEVIETRINNLGNVMFA